MVKRPKNLPTLPGVYIFKDLHGRALYIGKAANLKSRLAFYFQKEAAEQPKTAKLLKEAGRLQIIRTESDIAAIIKEAEMIKRFKPKYNIIMRDDKNYIFAAVTREQFPRIFLTHQPKTLGKAAYTIGPFTDAAALKTALRLLRKIFPYCTCRLPHKRVCINAEIGRCPGACCTKGTRFRKRSTRKEYIRNVRMIISILKGRSTISLIKKMRQELKQASKAMNYERAMVLRDQQFALNSIMHHRSTISNGRIDINNWAEFQEKITELLQLPHAVRRIEGYDISNISGTMATGSMVVFQDGIPDKSAYRKFRIKTVYGANDVAMLAEVLCRRFKHNEWGKPDLIILDGGKPQLNSVIKALNSKIGSSQLRTAITALAKRDEELYIQNRRNPIPLKRQRREILHFFQRIRDEAHRFAKAYHHVIRHRNYEHP